MYIHIGIYAKRDHLTHADVKIFREILNTVADEKATGLLLDVRTAAEAGGAENEKEYYRWRHVFAGLDPVGLSLGQFYFDYNSNYSGSFCPRHSVLSLLLTVCIRIR